MKDFPFLAFRAAANSRGDLLQWPPSLLISNQLPNGDDITAHLVLTSSYCTLVETISFTQCVIPETLLVRVKTSNGVDLYMAK